MDNNYSITNDFKMYIWEYHGHNTTDGLVVVIASTLEEAKALLQTKSEDGVCTIKWEDYITKPLNEPLVLLTLDKLASL